MLKLELHSVRFSLKLFLKKKSYKIKKKKLNCLDSKVHRMVLIRTA